MPHIEDCWKGNRRLVFMPKISTAPGEEPTLRGFYHGCGFNSAGMMFGGGCGWQLAQWVVQGRPELDMFGYDVRRFSPHLTRNPVWIRQRRSELSLSILSLHPPSLFSFPLVEDSLVRFLCYWAILFFLFKSMLVGCLWARLRFIDFYTISFCFNLFLHFWGTGFCRCVLQFEFLFCVRHQPSWFSFNWFWSVFFVTGLGWIFLSFFFLFLALFGQWVLPLRSLVFFFVWVYISIFASSQFIKVITNNLLGVTNMSSWYRWFLKHSFQIFTGFSSFFFA